MLSIISFFSFNLEFTNVKKLRVVTFDEFLFITIELFIKKSDGFERNFSGKYMKSLIHSIKIDIRYKCHSKSDQIFRMPCIQNFDVLKYY